MTDSPHSSRPSPTIIPRAEHGISRSNISKSALKVLYRLKDAGYQAFVVGGGVRDLLLDMRPKDFDIATDAEPEQVHALFRNSRLIGRRFRLAHVRFGREIIEVATFRGIAGEDHADSEHRIDDNGRILADNVYGTIEEDAWRRDFTVNALYYNIADFSVWEFAGGYTDLKARRMRMIGDPDKRYREDPVRMLRAARLAAKLDFSIDAATAAPVPELAPLIADVPSARLFEEYLKIFHSGHAVASYERLRELGLFAELFPATSEWLNQGEPESRDALLRAALASTDARVAKDQPVTPMFLYGVFLWGPVSERAAVLGTEQDIPEHDALALAIEEQLAAQLGRIALPKRFSFPMREMLQLQPRFERQQGRRGMNFLSHRRFRAAYDLLVLRAACGDADPELAAWWTEVQELDEDECRKRFGAGGGKRRRGGRRRKRPARAV